ncbi:MAG: 30S ribosomal protein S27e [Candidatus Diapherotrites archaeon CG11_big_fil_rev_8_21_14_0_20_37_9]|nr:MAG: 30S ribosomal protein S27e [Candidatus Diapherotrites archaeon CG11_big_fil_rev_8_21_14_0_20_37_9]
MINVNDLIPKPKTRFYRLKCPGCGNEQNVFSAASTKVKCLACNTVLAETRASKIKVKTKILKIFE